MDSSSFLNWEFKKFLIESYDGKTVHNMTSCIFAATYYEDLFSPSIFISISLIDTTGTLSSLINETSGSQPGIKGGERVSFEVVNLSTGQSFKVDETTSPYHIYKIHSSITDYTREVFTVELCPAEVFQNETSRVIKKYDGNIKTTVEKILKESFGSTAFKSQNIESTSNSYVFYGNTKRPFTVLTWLCPKSIPEKSKSSPEEGTAGFLFYQNKNGFNFKSMDSLLSPFKPGTSDRKSITSYYYGTVEDYGSINSNFLIKNPPTFEKNVNIMENLRIGMYSTNNYFFDVNSRKFYSYEYNLKKSYNLMSHTSGKNVSPPVPLGLDKNPSRLMVRILDNFNADPAGDNPSVTPAINNSKDQTPLYQAASIARYNLAFSQTMSITVPLNLNLTVGDLIRIEFPKVTLDSNKKKDDQKTGNYLIKELAHSFVKNQGYTGLKLIRDSYGENL